jgi:dimethylargininase
MGPPSYQKAVEQHDAYCAALSTCELTLIRLPELDDHPDGTFVEDAAVVTGRGAIVMRPGAAVRRSEVASVEAALRGLTPILGTIEPPGTVDGGDVCQTDERFLIGLSDRTNEAGARRLASILETNGYAATLVDLRGIPSLLHLKSGLTSLGGGRLAAVPALAERPELSVYEILPIAPEEAYAGNGVAIDGHALIARGYPLLSAALAARGFAVTALAMSEFEKMDGGISCLSIRL